MCSEDSVCWRLFLSLCSCPRLRESPSRRWSSISRTAFRCAGSANGPTCTLCRCRARLAQPLSNLGLILFYGPSRLQPNSQGLASRPEIVTRWADLLIVQASVAQRRIWRSFPPRQVLIADRTDESRWRRRSGTSLRSVKRLLEL